MLLAHAIDAGSCVERSPADNTNAAVQCGLRHLPPAALDPSYVSYQCGGRALRPVSHKTDLPASPVNVRCWVV